MSGTGKWKRARTQLQKEMGFLLIIKNKTNKNNPVGEKQTGRLDKAGQGRTGQGRAGQGRAGQGRAGQGRAGQGRAGQGRAGHKAYIKRR